LLAALVMVVVDVLIGKLLAGKLPAVLRLQYITLPRPSYMVGTAAIPTMQQ
jgi:hypothetical protein